MNRATTSGTRRFPVRQPRIKLDDNYAGIQINAAYIVMSKGLRSRVNIPNLSADEAMRRALLPPEKKSEALDNSLFNGSGIFAYPKEGRNPHHLIIRNNYVFNCPATGIAANGADYIRIENNRVHNNSYYSAYATSGVSFYQTRGIDDSSAAKMFVRNNVIYGNENKVPFWFSNENSPSQRVITDGNGVIVDDGRNTQSIVGDVSVAYKGKTVIENNLVYGNGGRGVNVYSSDNVQIPLQYDLSKCQSGLECHHLRTEPSVTRAMCNSSATSSWPVLSVNSSALTTRAWRDLEQQPLFRRLGRTRVSRWLEAQPCPKRGLQRQPGKLGLVQSRRRRLRAKYP